MDQLPDAAALRESLAAGRQDRRALQRLERPELRARQLARLNALLARILPHNPFYAAKLAGIAVPLLSLDALQAWPFTTKDELAPAAESELFVANLTHPLDQYLRFHQTSGTKARPLVVPDDAEGWQDWIDGWQFVLDAAELVPGDRALLAFSFGPFVGFWSAFDAVIARGCMAIPAGGMNTEARLDLLGRSGAVAVFCTPSYALHMAETAQRLGVDLAALPVRVLIVAGEPGGSIPATRAKIETAWNARLIDHAGATEVGPWGFADAQGRGLHVNESQFIAEFFSVQSGQPAVEGELSELVLTNLGRPGTPIIRYRTGDLVRPIWEHGQDCRFVFLDGGVLGRADEMLIIRGVNVYPSAIEQILRGFPDIAEYRLTASREGEMDQLQIEIEDAQHDPQRVAREVQVRLGLRVTVVDVPPGTLPRFEGKGRRFVDRRGG